MSEMKTGICPKCKKELSVPADLAEFSCVYCGERILRADWDAAEKAALEKKNAFHLPMSSMEADLKTFAAALTKCLHQHRKLACLEDIAYMNGWITREDVLETYEVMKKNQYGQYLKDVLDGKYIDKK